jgi:hypothetical protein
VSRRFSPSPSHFPLPSPFTAPWLTPLLVLLLLSLLRRPTLMTQGMTLGRKAPRWSPLLLQLMALQKWWKEKSQNSPTVTEDDHRAYHDRGWLTGNLVSFIPEVDAPIIEGSTVLCFESQLAAGLGLPPSKFLSSIMNYLECSLFQLNPMLFLCLVAS